MHAYKIASIHTHYIHIYMHFRNHFPWNKNHKEIEKYSK